MNFREQNVNYAIIWHFCYLFYYFCSMKIGIFCSANDNIDAEYFKRTEELGQWAAQNGHVIVFGGCNMGLMECVSKAAKSNKGMTIGVVPTKVEERGKVSSWLDVHIPCSDLTDRKQLLMLQSDVFVALPGGIGTLDEIFTVVASATIGYHNKPLVLYNINGFWDSMIAMLDDLTEKGMIRGQWREHIKVATNLEEVRLNCVK